MDTWNMFVGLNWKYNPFLNYYKLELKLNHIVSVQRYLRLFIIFKCMQYDEDNYEQPAVYK